MRLDRMPVGMQVSVCFLGIHGRLAAKLLSPETMPSAQSPSISMLPITVRAVRVLSRMAHFPRQTVANNMRHTNVLARLSNTSTYKRTVLESIESQVLFDRIVACTCAASSCLVLRVFTQTILNTVKQTYSDGVYFRQMPFTQCLASVGVGNPSPCTS